MADMTRHVASCVAVAAVLLAGAPADAKITKNGMRLSEPLPLDVPLEPGVTPPEGTHLPNGQALNKVISAAYLLGAYREDGTWSGPSKNGQPIHNGAVAGPGEEEKGSMLTGYTWEPQGTSGTYVRREGSWFVGAELPAWEMDHGHPRWVPLRVAAATQAPGRPDVWLYTIEARWPVADGPSTWQPLCGVDEAGRAVAAVAVRGLYNHGRGVRGGGAKIDDSAFNVTFACVTAAVGKCAAACTDPTPGDATDECGDAGLEDYLGYRPWARLFTEVEDCHPELGCFEINDLADEHQACTRMIRADYCGNGGSHTLEGELIDVSDGIGINHSVSNLLQWPKEGQWKADGAKCIDVARWYNDTKLFCAQDDQGHYIETPIPRCEWGALGPGIIENQRKFIPTPPPTPRRPPPRSIDLPQ
jgi:hypothetical protein